MKVSQFNMLNAPAFLPLCSMATELRAAELRLSDAGAQLARRAEEAQVGSVAKGAAAEGTLAPCR